jgi:ABC-type Fe3+ transport system permease subunit
MVILANADSLALVILSATNEDMTEDARPFGIILGTVCWIMTVYMLYLNRDEKH